MTRPVGADIGGKLFRMELLMMMMILLIVPSQGFQMVTFSPMSKKSIDPAGSNSGKTRHNISLLLDRLLDDYNHHLRPDIGGSPTVVDVDIMVRSMGPISEADMTFSMDCYFRQTWRDTRLAHHQISSTDSELSLSVSMLNRIWKPDTYFYNGKNSYLHTITTPNKLVRLFPDGRILYSSRLTIKASCPMELRKFPMDVQLCPLNIGSFAYTQSEVIYNWNVERQIVIASGMKMSQFDLVSTPVSNYTMRTLHGEYSMLTVRFNLQRHMGSFLIQVYGPCMLLVVLSWVSFWLNREATADRVSLGVTTMLTMTFLGMEARDALPKVAYPTALDHFIFLSFGFIFATVVQFAFVHYFTKRGFGEVYFFENPDQQYYQHEELRKEGTTPPPAGNKVHPRGEQQIFTVENHLKSEASSISIQIQSGQDVEHQQQQGQSALQEESSAEVPRHSRWDGMQMNSVSTIDTVSRLLFPLSYVTINLVYWYWYL